MVGQGIVNACRLIGGRAGSIILTNDLRARIDRLYRALPFSEHDLGASHKDFGAEIEATCWKVTGAATKLGRSSGEIRAEVEAVWRDVLGKP